MASASPAHAASAARFARVPDLGDARRDDADDPGGHQYAAVLGDPALGIAFSEAEVRTGDDRGDRDEPAEREPPASLEPATLDHVS
jgi:hypothetical protein